MMRLPADRVHHNFRMAACQWVINPLRDSNAGTEIRRIAGQNQAFSNLKAQLDGGISTRLPMVSWLGFTVLQHNIGYTAPVTVVNVRMSVPAGLVVSYHLAPSNSG